MNIFQSMHLLKLQRIEQKDKINLNFQDQDTND